MIKHDMTEHERIVSIQSAENLASSITGFPCFNLSDLEIKGSVDFKPPSNLRLGHLAERIVSELIKASTNYEILFENIQLFENERTIGEIDFIIKALATGEVTHMEFAYKFYLYDPAIAQESILNWIGPNRNDSLNQKLDKLKRKQFPLLYHQELKSMLKTINVEDITQRLCLVASLYLPYQFKGDLSPEYRNVIKGYYLDMETFLSLHTASKLYYLPPKTNWGIQPSTNREWQDINSIGQSLNHQMAEKRSALCWQKEGAEYAQYFIVWWK